LDHFIFPLHGSGYAFLAFYNHRLRIAFFRHFGSPFTLLWHCIAWIHSLSRTDCTAWVCGMGLMHYGVLHRKWRRLLDQIVTSFSFTYLASPIYPSHWWLVLTCTRFPRFPPSFFFRCLLRAATTSCIFGVLEGHISCSRLGGESHTMGHA
jgi:hypothetical protein